YRQVEKWGEQNHPDGTGLDGSKYFADWARSLADENHDNGTLTWADILTEEFYEALAEKETSRLREELIQVAAVALQWADAIDHREYCGLEGLQLSDGYPLRSNSTDVQLHRGT